MRIILFSSQTFLIKELKKSNVFANLLVISKIEDILNLNRYSENILFLHHLDCDDNIANSLNILNNDFPNIKLIAIRNKTNNIEGCTVLKKGYKAYVSSISNVNIFESVINCVNNNNTWVYPELMQFLISSIPVNDNQQDNIIKDLSVKELEVLELVSQSKNNNEIANILSVAEITVKKHISSLFKKLNVKDRLSLALILRNQK